MKFKLDIPLEECGGDFKDLHNVPFHFLNALAAIQIKCSLEDQL